MTEPFFQMFECENTACRLRFPSDLSTSRMEHCPVCGSQMRTTGNAYNNFHRPSTRKLLTDITLSILLDNLRSAENVGSIFRTANGAGVAHLYCCGTTPTPQHSRVRKSSLGAETEVDWSYHPNSQDLAKILLEESHHLVALESTMESRSLLDNTHLDMPNMKIVLILGNEISGIDPELLSLANEVVHIPMAGTKTSLNVAVAAGIALYQLIKTLGSPLQRDENSITIAAISSEDE